MIGLPASSRAQRRIGPLQAVVGLEDERALAVAPLDFVAQHVQHHAAQAGIDAVDAPGTVGEIVGIAEGDAVQRVRDREHIAANVVGGARADTSPPPDLDPLRATASIVRPRASITMLDGVK